MGFATSLYQQRLYLLYSDVANDHRKPKQSYDVAGGGRQQHSHTAAAAVSHFTTNRATVTVIVTV